jgi:hypothetical protein
MEDLVDRKDLIDGELVKAVTKALPGASIERVLDETRIIIKLRSEKHVNKSPRCLCFRPKR